MGKGKEPFSERSRKKKEGGERKKERREERREGDEMEGRGGGYLFQQKLWFNCAFAKSAAIRSELLSLFLSPSDSRRARMVLSSSVIVRAQ